MKEPHREGLAIHPDPKSCASSRKGAGEALAGAHVGPVWSPEMVFSSQVPTPLRLGGRLHRGRRSVEVYRGPCGVRGLGQAWKLQAREPGDPRHARGE